LCILSRYMSATLGPLAPKPLPTIVHKYAGDLATVGKGEILITT
jgi:formylmethanofuran dehydrogenase subunit C